MLWSATAPSSCSSPAGHRRCGHRSRGAERRSRCRSSLHLRQPVRPAEKPAVEPLEGSSRSPLSGSPVVLDQPRAKRAPDTRTLHESDFASARMLAPVVRVVPFELPAELPRTQEQDVMVDVVASLVLRQPAGRAGCQASRTSCRTAGSPASFTCPCRATCEPLAPDSQRRGRTGKTVEECVSRSGRSWPARRGPPPGQAARSPARASRKAARCSGCRSDQ